MINLPDFRVPSSNDTADAGLVHAEGRLLALEAWCRSTTTDDFDVETARKLVAPLERYIAETPAHTLVGLAVKLRALGRLEAEGLSAEWSRPCVETAIAVVVDLVGGPRPVPLA
jgi:hypothetical protein